MPVRSRTASRFGELPTSSRQSSHFAQDVRLRHTGEVHAQRNARGDLPARLLHGQGRWQRKHCIATEGKEAQLPHETCAKRPPGLICSTGWVTNSTFASTPAQRSPRPGCSQCKQSEIFTASNIANERKAVVISWFSGILAWKEISCVISRHGGLAL